MKLLILSFIIIIGTISCESTSLEYEVNNKPKNITTIDSISVEEKLKRPYLSNEMDTTGKTEIIVDKLKHDLGDIISGETVDCQFMITNVGNNPLHIKMYTTSGGGLVPQAGYRRHIPVGEQETFYLKFNTTGKIGKQSKKARIIANTIPSNTYIELVSNVIEVEEK